MGCPRPAAAPAANRALPIFGALASAGIPSAQEDAVRIDQALAGSVEAYCPVDINRALQPVLVRDYGLMPGDLVESRLHAGRHIAVVTGVTIAGGRPGVTVRIFQPGEKGWGAFAPQRAILPAALDPKYRGQEAYEERIRLWGAVQYQHQYDLARERVRWQQMMEVLQNPDRPLPAAAP